MTQLQELLNQEYKKKEDSVISTTKLLEMIESVLEDVLEIEPLREATPQLQLPLGKEYFQQTPEALEFTYRAIPEIPISELGWTSLESNDNSTGEKRQQLQQFLDLIHGKNLRENLRQLEKMLANPSAVINQKASGKSDAEKIAVTLAYLVFFKTLTTIITNFNAASAGFSFESFLGVLLGGNQIATGNKTIADLTDENGVPISLKLYAEKAAKAGGSYTDLVNDLTSKEGATTGTGQGSYMQYVVAMKELTNPEDPLERSGTLTFYRYNLTLQNICQILGGSASKESNLDVRLPKGIIDGTIKLDTRRLKMPRQPSMQEKEKIFVDAVRHHIPHISEEVFQALNYSKNGALFRISGEQKGSFRPGTGKKLPWSGDPRTGSPVIEILQGLVETGDLAAEEVEHTYEIIYRANEAALEKVREYQSRYDAFRARWEEGGDWASTAESVNFYNKLATRPSLQQKALLFTWGYQNRKQFELTKGDIRDIARLAGSYLAFGTAATGTAGQTDVQIGTITVGRQQIQELLNKSVNIINGAVFEIFNSLKTLNDSLQAYFAGAMDDSAHAREAIDSAEDISRRTTEFREEN